jgi:hypothetical protein
VAPIKRGATQAASLAYHLFPITAVVVLTVFLVWVQAMSASP